MSSTLNKGTVFDTKDELQAAILRTTTSTTKDFRIQRNTKLQYHAVCYSNKGIKGWENNPSDIPDGSKYKIDYVKAKVKEQPKGDINGLKDFGLMALTMLLIL